MNNTYLDTMVEHYLICALATETDDDTYLEDNYGLSDIAEETRQTAEADCKEFVVRTNVDLDPEQVGHDFWLTRNGHGAGFWDRGLGETGDILSNVATSFNVTNLYVGDDGTLYLT